MKVNILTSLFFFYFLKIDFNFTIIFLVYDDDPESYFMDKRRQASPIYKVHCMEQLKKEFSKISVKVIKEIFSQNNCLFLPSVRDLEKHMQNKKNAKSLMKTKRKYDAANVPGEVDIEFLKELQYFRKEAEIQKFLDKDNSILNKKIQEAKDFLHSSRGFFVCLDVALTCQAAIKLLIPTSGNFILVTILADHFFREGFQRHTALSGLQF